MADQPKIQRDGDSWALVWDSFGVAMGVEGLRETRDGLRAEITVESTIAGRVVGPVHLNILSSESQTRFANACATRVNGLSKETWHALVVQACATVTKQYRIPTPTLNLADVETAGETEYLIPGLIPDDETTVLYGDGDSSKSLTALRIAASVRLGQVLPWNDRPTRTCQVLYLDWETNPKTAANRLNRIAMGMQTSVPDILYRQCFRSLQDDLPNIREEVSKKKVGLVIVDSIGFAASGALTEDETARAAMNALRQLSPATRLVVAHVSAEQARQTSGTAAPFGSRFFWNGMRSGIEIRRAEEGADSDSMEVGLFHRKGNDGAKQKPIGMSVQFDGRSGPIAFWESDVQETPDLAARTTISSRLRALLRKAREPMTADDLSVALALPVDSVGRTLRRMSDVQQIEQGGGRNKAATWGLASDR